MIASFEVVKRNLTKGDGEVETVLKVKLVDRARYTEMAMKHLGLLTERVELSDPHAVIARLQAARKRARA